MTSAAACVAGGARNRGALKGSYPEDLQDRDAGGAHSRWIFMSLWSGDLQGRVVEGARSGKTCKSVLPEKLAVGESS